MRCLDIDELKKINYKLSYRILNYILLIFVILLLSSCSKINFENDDSNNIPLPINSVSFGVKNPKNNKIFDSGDLLPIFNNKISVNLDIEQNLLTPKDYILIVLVNNIQREFVHNKEKYNSMIIALKEQEDIIIDVDVNTFEENDREIQFILFQNPNYINTSIPPEKDILTPVEFRMSFSQRFLLYKIHDNLPEIEYDNKIKEIEFNDKLNVFLTNNVEKLNIVVNVKSGEKLQLVLTNPYEEEFTVAIGLLLGWEQTAFGDDKILKYVKIKPQSTYVLDLETPTIKEVMPYQVYVVPHAYLLSKDIKKIPINYYDFTIATLRTTAMP